MKNRWLLLTAISLLILAGCGGGDSLPDATVTVGVSADVSGLTTGQQVVLQNNNSDDLTVTADGSHSFTTEIAFGTQYDVTVKTQPSGLICIADNPSGIAAGAVSVAVACTTPTTVTGTLESSTSGAILGGVTIEARNPKDDSVLSSVTTVTDVGFSIDVPTGHDFYLHAEGTNVDGTVYTSSNLQIGQDTDYSGTVKFYYTDTATVNTMLTALGMTSTDAVFSMDIENSSTGIAGVTVSTSPAVTKILYNKDGAGTFSTTGPTTTNTGSSVIGNVTSPGANATYTFTLSPDQTTSGYTIDTTFKLRLIPGEISSPLAP